MSSEQFIKSSIATATAELCTLPICTAKTVYQNSHFKSISEAFIFIYKDRGIAGFYKASIPSIGGQVFSTASKWTLYNNINSKYPNTKFINGMISGILVSTITHTADVIKVHMQMNSKNLIDKISKNPINTLYSGYKWTFIKSSISGPLFFPLFQFFKDKTNSVFLGSLFASIIGCIGMQPIDYFKTRSMYGNKIDLINPFKGLSINLMRVVPHFIIVMTVMDKLK